MALSSQATAGMIAASTERKREMSDISALTAAVQAFRDARDWRQFHSLRNLIVSLNLEAAELLELTQWKSDAEIAALREAVRDASVVLRYKGFNVVAWALRVPAVRRALEAKS